MCLFYNLRIQYWKWGVSVLSVCCTLTSLHQEDSHPNILVSVKHLMHAHGISSVTGLLKPALEPCPGDRGRFIHHRRKVLGHPPQPSTASMCQQPEQQLLVWHRDPAQQHGNLSIRQHLPHQTWERLESRTVCLLKILEKCGFPSAPRSRGLCLLIQFHPSGAMQEYR